MVTGTAKTTPEEFRRQTFAGKRWVPFAKGGAYSPYYADIHLVVNWERDGEEMNEFAGSVIRNPGFYFHPGLTWPLRAVRFAPSVLPPGSIFSARGYAILASISDLVVLSGLGNSVPFDFIFKILLGRFDFPEFIVGVLQQLPVVDLSNSTGARLVELAAACMSLKRAYDTASETSHVFHLPALLQVGTNLMFAQSAEARRPQGSPLQECIAAWQTRVAETELQLAECQREIDDVAFQLYGIESDDRRAIEEVTSDKWIVTSNEEGSEGTDTEEDTENQTFVTRHSSLVTDLLSYAVGCSLGRWDVRFATGERQAPELPDPFAPLPVCSPGMLTGDDGLPLRETPADYPLQIDWDGILVDDPDHPDDIIRRVHEALEIIWGRRAETIEHEACEILDVRELRDYFRKPGNGGFWMDHVRRYSKSRRKAPIYWLLQSSRKNYALWIYYHRLDKDILFKALVNYVEPKLRLEENRLEQLRAQSANAGTSGREAKQLEKQLERQETLLSELRDFHDKLRRAADLHLEPDLNDGVILNIAPLWELVPWNEAEAYWEELLTGKYEWSSIGKQLCQKGLVGKR